MKNLWNDNLETNFLHIGLGLEAFNLFQQFKFLRSFLLRILRKKIILLKLAHFTFIRHKDIKISFDILMQLFLQAQSTVHFIK